VFVFTGAVGVVAISVVVVTVAGMTVAGLKVFHLFGESGDERERRDEFAFAGCEFFGQGCAHAH
jgi:hypothetical protein